MEDSWFTFSCNNDLKKKNNQNMYGSIKTFQNNPSDAVTPHYIK